MVAPVDVNCIFDAVMFNIEPRSSGEASTILRMAGHTPLSLVEVIRQAIRFGVRAAQYDYDVQHDHRGQRGFADFFGALYTNSE